MAQKEATVFESAMRGMRHSKHGRVVQIVADGNGACVVLDVEFNAAQKWGMGRTSAGNSGADRTKIFDQLTTLIARPGSFVNTRGNDKPIEDIARFMQAAGFDLNDWSLPPSVKALFSKGPAPKPKPQSQSAPDSPSDDGKLPTAAD